MGVGEARGDIRSTLVSAMGDLLLTKLVREEKAAALKPGCEILILEKLFEIVDKNGNGQISMEEVRSEVETVFHRKLPFLYERIRNTMDTDHNGIITRNDLDLLKAAVATSQGSADTDAADF